MYSKESWAAPRRETPLSGLINVDKPAGMTSHDVVDAVRRLAGQRKVGHAGTLDPMATGVLVICLGVATRLAEYVMAGQKRYRAGIRFGATTDTYDAEGRVVAEGGKTDFSRQQIESALACFVGRIEQVPPLYSALKRDGKPLYKLARQGVAVERSPRPVDIQELILLGWEPPLLIVEVACSPGTYIRSLAHDLGRHLGGGAHLASLVRLRSGRFTLEDAVSLERLEEAFRNGEEGDWIQAPDEALLDWPAIVLGAEDATRLVHGGSVVAEASRNAGPLCRAYDLDGQFLALVHRDASTGMWRPKKVLVTPDV